MALFSWQAMRCKGQRLPGATGSIPEVIKHPVRLLLLLLEGVGGAPPHPHHIAGIFSGAPEHFVF
jgi:hypothetical protein